MREVTARILLFSGDRRCGLTTARTSDSTGFARQYKHVHICVDSEGEPPLYPLETTTHETRFKRFDPSSYSSTCSPAHCSQHAIRSSGVHVSELPCVGCMHNTTNFTPIVCKKPTFRLSQLDLYLFPYIAKCDQGFFGHLSCRYNNLQGCVFH